jgi:hypothetical protein
VHVTSAPGSIDDAPAGQDTDGTPPEPLNDNSATDTFDTVTLPVLVTTKL